MSKTTPVKILDYHVNRARKFVGENKPYPSLSQLASRALSDICDKLEEKQV